MGTILRHDDRQTSYEMALLRSLNMTLCSLIPTPHQHGPGDRCRDHRSILTLYHRLLALRREDRVFTRGRQRELPVDGDVVAYRREDGDRRAGLALNLGSREVEVETPGAAGGTIALSTGLDREGEAVGRSLRLRGDEGCVVVLGTG